MRLSATDAYGQTPRVALRIIEERAELVHRIAEDERQNGWLTLAKMYESRAIEYRSYANMIRRVMLESLDPKPPKG